MQKNDVKNANLGSTGTQVQQPKKDDLSKNPQQKPGSNPGRTEKQDDQFSPSNSPRTNK